MHELGLQSHPHQIHHLRKVNDDAHVHVCAWGGHVCWLRGGCRVLLVLAVLVALTFSRSVCALCVFLRLRIPTGNLLRTSIYIARWHGCINSSMRYAGEGRGGTNRETRTHSKSAGQGQGQGQLACAGAQAYGARVCVWVLVYCCVQTQGDYNVLAKEMLDEKEQSTSLKQVGGDTACNPCEGEARLVRTSDVMREQT